MHDPLVGSVIDGRYQIQQRVGEGGMGVVYRARQMSIDRDVAIKVLSQEMAKDPNWVQRFNQEARACSRLQHPNTIRMFDFGQAEGRLYMAMEFLDGQSLRDAIATGAPMAPVRVLKILIQCCASLSEAHSFGIIHRDIKPDNVFLLNLAGTPDFVKLLDFSVAKLLQENDAMRTQAGVVFGTPQYMSPEQGRGAPLDPRSDVYALGILAFEMLLGRVPFTDENPMTVLQMHIRQPVPPLPAVIPQQVRDIVNRALAKDPGQRFQSAEQMMQVCKQAFAALGAEAAAIAAAQAAPPSSADSERTVMAPGDGAPGVPPPSAPQWGGAAGAPEPPPAAAGESERTMMAPGGGGGFGPPPAAVKTMIADANAPMTGPPPMGPTGGAPTPEPAAPNKTMMLENSEGIVSFARRGESAAVKTPVPVPVEGAEDTSITDVGGASATFWIICLLTGLGVGVLAYLAVVMLD